MRYGCLLFTAVLLSGLGCRRGGAPLPAATAQAPAWDAWCKEVVGPPQVRQVTGRIWVATGFDLANVILIRTREGNVIVDAAMSPARAGPIKAALLARSPGPVRALVLTHSHIDHVGGASAFVEAGTQIWASRAFPEHFLQQYGLFQRSEARRGRRQFGSALPEALAPCSALGRRIDDDAARRSGARMPTNLVSGQARLALGDVTLDLYEAPGETHDHLLVHVREEGAVLPGDNFYRAFPNLYTIRGAAPRPVSGWIGSLDRARALRPAHLIPSHTAPLSGVEAIAAALRDYRDGIQWVRDETVRGALRGDALDELAATVRLPAHLRASPYLAETYGQVDWSVRAIYQNHLGWFDGHAAALYPPSPGDAARREVALMGGAPVVLAQAEAALASTEDGELRWAVHLLDKLQRGGGLQGAEAERLRTLLRRGYEALGLRAPSSNGRAYMLSAAQELDRAPAPPGPARPEEELLKAVPLETFFQVMATRLRPEAARDVEESVAFEFPDEDRRFTVTVRRGVAEVVEGAALAGTPPVLATLLTSGMTWRRLALHVSGVFGALLGNELRVEGSAVGLRRFLARFEQD